MKFHSENKICEGYKLRCKVAYNSTFKVGDEYTIDTIINMSMSAFNRYDILVNWYWFSIILNDLPNSIFPIASSYFFSEKEERKIKLQIVDLYSKTRKIRK